jgi:hypothetical protein
MNADQQPTYIVRLRPEPDTADPIRALRWMLRTSRSQFGMEVLNIEREEQSESAPAGKSSHPGESDAARKTTASIDVVSPRVPTIHAQATGQRAPAADHTPAPIVPVTRDGNTLIVKRCPFCGRPHRHGDGGNPRRGSDGSRISHCRRSQPAAYTLIECAEPITWVKK